MFRPLALSLAGAVMAGLAAPVAAAESDTYQKRRVVAFETADPVSQAARRGLQGLARVEYLPMSALPNELIPGFIARVREASKNAGGVPTYVFVPSYTLGTVSYTEPRAEDTRHANGLVETVVSSDMTCPLLYTVEVYDAASGKQLHTLKRHGSLKRRYETHYDQRHSDRTVGYKEGVLIATLAQEARRPPADLFADQIRAEIDVTASWLQGVVSDMEEFKLYARIVSWDNQKDVVYADLGKEIGIGLEHGYTLVRNGQELGYFRAVEVRDGRTTFQPVFLDALVARGDRLTEKSRSTAHLNVRTGMGWLTGPAVSGTLGFEPSIGTAFGVTDLGLPIEVSLLGNLNYAAFQLEAGLVKKHFFRRWGVSYGLKPGFLTTGQSGGFGATGLLGLHCYLTPGIVWSLEGGFQAYRAYTTASNPNTPVNPFGPVVRTSFTF